MVLQGTAPQACCKTRAVPQQALRHQMAGMYATATQHSSRITRVPATTQNYKSCCGANGCMHGEQPTALQ
jgi:hypothetical protein